MMAISAVPSASKDAFVRSRADCVMPGEAVLEGGKGGARSIATVARSLPQVSHDVRPEQVRDGDRQSTPGRDERAVLRVHGVVLRHSLAAVEDVLVVERRGLEPPVLLEVERAGADLAAAVVEDAVSAFAC